MRKDLAQNYMSTKLVTANVRESVVQAKHILQNHWIRHLPVVNDDGRIVGVVSDRDLLTATPTARLAEIMNRSIKGVDLEGDFIEIIDLMIEDKLSSCFILKGDEIVGIITTEDLLRLLRSSLTSKSIRNSIADYLISSPLGTVIQRLSDAGI